MSLGIKKSRRPRGDKDASIAAVQKEETKRLNVEIPKSTHLALKKMALSQETTMSELIVRWINEGLNQ